MNKFHAIHKTSSIYLPVRHCNLQYVGESTIPLNKRMNIHRTAKTGCEHYDQTFP